MKFFARYSLGLGVIVTAVLLPRFAWAAILAPTPEHVSVEVGRTVPVTLTLDSEGQSINVVAAQLQYPTELLDLVSVSQAGSFLTLWSDPPTINAAAGSVSFSGGVPNGTVAANGQVLSFLFRAKARGTAQITLDSASTEVYVNDGEGTKATVTSRAAIITVVNQDSLAPVITSSTHADESRWYRNRTLLVSWTQHEGAFYSYNLSPESTAAADAVADQAHGTASYPNLTDGIWYFTLKEKLGNDDWGPIATLRVMIDGTAPEPIEAAVVRDDPSRTWLLSFSALDSTSGLEQSVVDERRPVSAWFPFLMRNDRTVTSTPYRLHDQHQLSVLRITVTDAAGNSRSLTITNSQLRNQRWLMGAAYVALLLLLLLGARWLQRRR